MTFPPMRSPAGADTEGVLGQCSRLAASPAPTVKIFLTVIHNYVMEVVVASDTTHRREGQILHWLGWDFGIKPIGQLGNSGRQIYLMAPPGSLPPLYVTLYRKIRHNAAPKFFSFFLPAESMMPEDRILQVRGQ